MVGGGLNAGRCLRALIEWGVMLMRDNVCNVVYSLKQYDGQFDDLREKESENVRR